MSRATPRTLYRQAHPEGRKPKRTDEGSPFGAELAMLTRGVPLHQVLVSFCGSCSEGRAWLSWWEATLAEVKTRSLKRRIVAHWLRTFEGARMHGTMYRVTDAEAFVGRQHDYGPELVVDIDEDGCVHTRTTGRELRRHVPAYRGGRAGGLAARDKRSPRTLNAYRRVLRAGRLMGSKQPKQSATDAVLPKREGSTWAYGHHWLGLAPSAEMRSRWGARRSPPTGPRRRSTPPPASPTFVPPQPRRKGSPERLGGILDELLPDF